MDKFLNIIYASQIEKDIDKGDKFIENFAPLLEKLKELLSPKLYDEIEELFTDCCVDNNRHYAVEGMKLAIGIMDESYIPRV